jgi:hypothetical protein
MLNRYIGPCAAALIAAASWNMSPAQALTMKECSAKYKEAQTAGILKGRSWNEFRKAECASTAAVAPKASERSATTGTATPARRAPAATGNAVFPSAVSSKYSKESAGKARMHTCLDQYNANKASNANGGLHWIQKGGGYYSECNKRLKG